MHTNEIIHINGRYHKTDCDLIDDKHVAIRIKTGKDIRHIEFVYNDPYIHLNTQEGLYQPFHTAEMKQTGNTYTNNYYTAIIPCNLHRLKYYFKIYSDPECVQYSESGFTTGYNHDNLAMFFIPYITESNIFTPQSWINDIVWYQILPIRFNKNIKGIIDKLDYLHELGINGLYINPIYKGKSYHKYDVIDYTKVDEELGDEENFKNLCKKAHDLGMKVMLDISFIHCSDLNPMFQDVIARHRRSPYFEIFKVLETDDGELEYETFGMIRLMPKFETESFKTISFFANDVVKKWMRLGVDAWRLDVANEISDNMLDNIKDVIKDEKKDTYVVGEI